MFFHISVEYSFFQFAKIQQFYDMTICTFDKSFPKYKGKVYFCNLFVRQVDGINNVKC